MFVCILLLFDQSSKNLIIGGFKASADKSFNLNLTVLKELDPLPIGNGSIIQRKREKHAIVVWRERREGE